MISYKNSPVACAILAWLGLAFGVFCWNLFWLVIGVSGVMEVAHDPYYFGWFPARLLGWPWSRWFIDIESISISVQILIFLSLCINATILGLFFGVIQKATPMSFAALRAIFKLIFALTVIPMFIAVMVLNIDVVHKVVPGLLLNAGSKVGIVVAAPAALLICFPWYRLFVFLTEKLLGDLQQGPRPSKNL